MRSIVNIRIASALAVVAFLFSAPARGKECSTEKVNRDCTLTIDRVNPLSPPTLQMYPRSVVTVEIKNALPFEQVSLDWQSSASTLAPDQASAVVNTLSPNIQKLVLAVSTPTPTPTPMAGRLSERATPRDLCATITPHTRDAALVESCVTQMIIDAKLVIVDIGGLVNDDTLVFSGTPGQKPVLRSASDFDDVRARILCRILGDGLSGFKKLDGTPSICKPGNGEPPYHDLVSEQQTLNNLTGSGGAITTGNVPALVNYTNTLVSALEGIAQNLIDLTTAQPSYGVLGTIVDPARDKNPSARSCNSSLSVSPNSNLYGRLLQRQVTCAVNVYNLVANSIVSVPTSSQKRNMVTITVNYAETLIETSAGVMVSALPSRSFSATSVYSGAPPALSNVVVQESKTRPLIVPYAALNVRLGSDWLWPDHRRGAVYATILVGVNPNTTTADFGAGLSIAWRGLILSPVAHFTHDVRLTGFTNGESLGSGFTGALSTQQFWTTTFGLGIGVRVPLITGR